MEEQNQNKNVFLGIDLGTTNSVVAWGHKNRNGKFEAIVPKLTVFTEDRRMRKSQILPSCVYYKKGEAPIVGAYARKMMSLQSSRVVKSVKSFMGTDKKYLIDDVEITPAEVSSVILRQIATASREIFGFIPDNVIITVPASFGPDERADTIEAARLAGFKTTNPDGSPINILLNEPTAALYDFINRQELGDIPEPLIDFSEPRIILVFDLGGGTLDVSLHEVSKTPEGDVNEKPYAISRHTLLGGDNFDELLQNFLIKAFGRVDINSLDEGNAALIRSSFLEEAENAKIELNSMVENYRLQGRTDYGDIVYEIMHPNMYGNYPLVYDLSIEKYKEIIQKYLAPELNINAVERIDTLSNQTENIIYPILDVLNKAKIKLGYIPKIDAVLLNGGMSKLFAVRERIQEFFGFAPLEVGDPDLAVARGASVYHYWLTQGRKSQVIQNDDIGIKIEGNLVKKLIVAGTVLPYESEELEFATAADGALRLDLPFYRGSRSDILPPNERIATRRIRFDTPQPVNTVLKLKAFVDEAMMLSLKVKKEDGQEFSVDNVHTTTTERDLPLTFVIPSGGFKKKVAEVPVKSSEIVNIPDLILRYKKVSEAFAKNKIPEHNRQFTERLRTIENTIETAANSNEAIDEMAAIMEACGKTAENAARLLGRIARNSSENDKLKAMKYFERFCAIERVRANLNNANFFSVFNTGARRKLFIQSRAIQAMSMLRNPEHERLFINILNLRPFTVNFLTSELCYALGRVGHSSDAVYILSKCIEGPKADRISAFWALGRTGSRERQDAVSAGCLEKVLPRIFRAVKNETHPTALCNGIYAIGEMCDQRIPGEKAPERFVRDANEILQDISNQRNKTNNQTAGYIKIALNMIHGTELNLEQQENLLKLREQYSDDNGNE